MLRTSEKSENTVIRNHLHTYIKKNSDQKKWIGLWTSKNRLKHTQLNVYEKKELPCFLYLIQIFASHMVSEKKINDCLGHAN